MSSQDCVSREQLLACLSGKLADAENKKIFEHLDTCEICDSVAETLEAEKGEFEQELREVGLDLQPVQSTEIEQAIECNYDLIGEPGIRSVAKPLPPEAPTDALQAGSKVGRYVIEEFCGKGGMGVVYTARNPLITRRLFALKTIRPENMQEEGAVRRFQEGAEAAFSLDHPNIVRVTDFDDQDCFHLVMSYIDGPDLDKVVKDFGSLRVPDACEVIRQTALGLQHAEDHGVIHRDVKPANLMLAGPTVKLTDFGLAKLRELPATTVSTGQGPSEHGLKGIESTKGPMGTLHYMAPEICDPQRSGDGRSDIYSLGCSFYCLLSGKPPFHAYKSPAEIMKAHRNEQYEPLALRGRQGRKVNEILDSMLQKDPDKRFQTAAEVARSLENLCRLAKLNEVHDGQWRRHFKAEQSHPVREYVAWCLVGVLAVAFLALAASRLPSVTARGPIAPPTRDPENTHDSRRDSIAIFDPSLGKFSEEFDSWESTEKSQVHVSLLKIEPSDAQVDYFATTGGSLGVRFDYSPDSFCSANVSVGRMRDGNRRLNLYDVKDGYIELRIAPERNSGIRSFGLELVRIGGPPFYEARFEFKEEFLDPATGWYVFRVPVALVLDAERENKTGPELFGSINQILITLSNRYSDGTTGILYLDAVTIVK